MNESNRILDSRRSVNDIIRDYPAAVTLLGSYRIDTCCRGNESLAKAASDLGLDPARIAAEIVAGEIRCAEQPARHSCACGCTN